MRKTITRWAGMAGALGLAAALMGAGAPAQAAVAAPHTAVQPMTYRSTTLWLPDGKRTATVWKTWYRNSDGRYHGHYGFTSASHGVSVYVVLWTSDRTKYLPTEGKRYSYSDESTVQLFACDNSYPNDEDCTATW
ncbi:hypothetical protein FB563_6360 [Streptomyces puniciscabiei]|uniref:Secreted protein n=2 Tax=Streptomyces puniciscabiei TaxID=164348 RepID=A0A542THG7_9ACTN|nr:hypothetical protein FB563_6360 [Streptomyces puniciscabiei]